MSENKPRTRLGKYVGDVFEALEECVDETRECVEGIIENTDAVQKSAFKTARRALRPGSRREKPVYRTPEGVVRDPARPEASGSRVIRAELQSGRRLRITDEETGADCTVEVLAEFLLAACARSGGLLGEYPEADPSAERE